jgi:hypothetical protein
MVTVVDVRRVALALPRSTEHLIHDRVKFRVRSLVYVAFSRDETLMGFAFPKEERAALVESDPHTFQLPGTSDLRFNWVVARTAALDVQEMTELVVDAWTMVVPKGVARDHLEGPGGTSGPGGPGRPG